MKNQKQIIDTKTATLTTRYIGSRNRKMVELIQDDTNGNYTVKVKNEGGTLLIREYKSRWYAKKKFEEYKLIII